MREKIKMGPEEVVLVEISGAVPDFKKASMSRTTLILTNERVLWCEFTTFVKIKNEREFGIHEIKLYDNKPHVIVKDKIGEPLVLYFYLYADTLSFKVEDKFEARKLISTLYRLVTGETTDRPQAIHSIVDGFNIAADTFGSAILGLKKSLGIRQIQKDQEVASCPSCGASITGRIGEVVQCPYCHTNVKL